MLTWDKLDNNSFLTIPPANMIGFTYPLRPASPVFASSVLNTPVKVGRPYSLRFHVSDMPYGI